MFDELIDRTEKWIIQADEENTKMYSELGKRYSRDRAIGSVWTLFGTAIIAIGFGLVIVYGAGFDLFILMFAGSILFLVSIIFMQPLYRIHQYRKLKNAKNLPDDKEG
jgi:Flp pilus assembly protein TadB